MVSKENIIVAMVLVFTITVAVIGSFMIGREYSRQQIRDITAQMAAQGPTNTFSRCLAELWEQSGELDPQWEGKRFWLLVDETGQPVKEE
jgi:hypothetical protein